MADTKTVRFIIRRDYMDDMIAALANSGYHTWVEDNEEERKYGEPYVYYVCCKIEERKYGEKE